MPEIELLRPIDLQGAKAPVVERAERQDGGDGGLSGRGIAEQDQEAVLMQRLQRLPVCVGRNEAAKVRSHRVQDRLGLLVPVARDDVREVADAIDPRHEHPQFGVLSELLDDPVMAEDPAGLHSHRLKGRADLRVRGPGHARIGEDDIVVRQSLGGELFGLRQLRLHRRQAEARAGLTDELALQGRLGGIAAVAR